MNKLAIIIPYYKFEFFEKCLNSLANQTNKRFTIYIGDDCSPVNPIHLINQYSTSLDIHYYRFDENLGGNQLTRQWDRCITLAKDEEWIMLLGDDDEVSENLVQSFYDHLPEITAENYNVLRTNVAEIDEQDSVLCTFEFPKTEKASTAYIKKITENYHISLPEYIFKKSVYNKYGFKHFPFAFGSDEIAWLEFSEDKPIFTIPDTWTKMRTSQFSISGNKQNQPEKVYAMYLTKKYIITHLFSKFNKTEKATIISKAYRNLLFSGNKQYLTRIIFILKTLRYLSPTQFYRFFLK